jgi:hypothetical protein
MNTIEPGWVDTMARMGLVEATAPVGLMDAIAPNGSLDAITPISKQLSGGKVTHESLEGTFQDSVVDPFLEFVSLVTQA